MNAIEIINTWNAMTDTQQIELCWKCIWTKIHQGRTVGLGDTMEDIFQSVFENVLSRLENMDTLEADCKRRESQGKAPNTLVGIVYRAANNILTNSVYHGQKNGKATRWTVTDETGDELDMLDTIAAADNTEKAAITRTTLQQFIASRDTIDQQIIQGKVDGLTEREIAAIVGISGPAVNKRIAKIRTALAPIIF